MKKPEAQSCWVIYPRPHSLWAAELRLAASLPWELPSYWLPPLPSSEVTQEVTSPALRWENIDPLFHRWGKFFCSPGFLAAAFFLAWGPKLWLLLKSSRGKGWYKIIVEAQSWNVDYFIFVNFVSNNNVFKSPVVQFLLSEWPKQCHPTPGLYIDVWIARYNQQTTSDTSRPNMPTHQQPTICWALENAPRSIIPSHSFLPRNQGLSERVAYWNFKFTLSTKSLSWVVRSLNPRMLMWGRNPIWLGGWGLQGCGRGWACLRMGAGIGFEAYPQKWVGLAWPERKTFHVQRCVREPLAMARAREKSTAFGVLGNEVRMIPTDLASLQGAGKRTCTLLIGVWRYGAQKSDFCMRPVESAFTLHSYVLCCYMFSSCPRSCVFKCHELW